MKYCFYETTNLVNGKKYLGIHGSEDFQEWWKVNCKNYARVHYSVKHFLRELGLSKSEFLNKMREKGEI